MRRTTAAGEAAVVTRASHPDGTMCEQRRRPHGRSNDVGHGYFVRREGGLAAYSRWTKGHVRKGTTVGVRPFLSKFTP